MKASNQFEKSLLPSKEKSFFAISLKCKILLNQHYQNYWWRNYSRSFLAEFLFSLWAVLESIYANWKSRKNLILLCDDKFYRKLKLSAICLCQNVFTDGKNLTNWQIKRKGISNRYSSEIVSWEYSLGESWMMWHLKRILC